MTVSLLMNGKETHGNVLMEVKLSSLLGNVTWCQQPRAHSQKTTPGSQV